MNQSDIVFFGIDAVHSKKTVTVYHTWITKCLHRSNFFFLKDDLNLNKIINITMHGISPFGHLYSGDTSIQGTQNLVLEKCQSHNLYICLTFAKGTPLRKGHFFCNRQQNCCRMISGNKRTHTPSPPLHSELVCLLFSTGT